MTTPKSPATPELKNCPFCGGKVELEQTVDGSRFWGVVCRNTKNLGGTCAIHQIPSRTKEAAITRWNNRIPPKVDVEGGDVPEWLNTLDYQRDLAIIWMVAKQSKEYDETIGDRIERVQSLILAQKAALSRPAEATPEPQPVPDLEVLKEEVTGLKTVYLRGSVHEAEVIADRLRLIDHLASRNLIRTAPMDRWQPIETALDRDPLLLWDVYGYAIIGDWSEVYDCWCQTSDEHRTTITPTHWMPLPPAPTANKGV